jgi:hypothetical protein
MQTDIQARWNKINFALQEWRRFHRLYAPQIVIWQKHFAQLNLECEKHLCEYRNSRKPLHLQKAEKLINQAEQEFKILSRLEFLASLNHKY